VLLRPQLGADNGLMAPWRPSSGPGGAPLFSAACRRTVPAGAGRCSHATETRRIMWYWIECSTRGGSWVPAERAGWEAVCPCFQPSAPSCPIGPSGPRRPPQPTCRCVPPRVCVRTPQEQPPTVRSSAECSERPPTHTGARRATESWSVCDKWWGCCFTKMQRHGGPPVAGEQKGNGGPAETSPLAHTKAALAAKGVPAHAPGTGSTQSTHTAHTYTEPTHMLTRTAYTQTRGACEQLGARSSTQWARRENTRGCTSLHQSLTCQAVRSGAVGTHTPHGGKCWLRKSATQAGAQVIDRVHACACRLPDDEARGTYQTPWHSGH
jgi:hypothetical protein